MATLEEVKDQNDALNAEVQAPKTEIKTANAITNTKRKRKLPPPLPSSAHTGPPPLPASVSYPPPLPKNTVALKIGDQIILQGLQTIKFNGLTGKIIRIEDQLITVTITIDEKQKAIRVPAANVKRKHGNTLASASYSVSAGREPASPSSSRNRRCRSQARKSERKNNIRSRGRGRSQSPGLDERDKLLLDIRIVGSQRTIKSKDGTRAQTKDTSKKGKKKRKKKRGFIARTLRRHRVLHPQTYTASYTYILDT